MSQMSTNAYILRKKKNSNNQYEGIHLHYDGYPEYAGEILKEYYGTDEKIDELFALGNLVSIGPNINPDSEKPHTFLEPQEDVCLAYHRDLGEELSKVDLIRDKFGTYILTANGWKTNDWKPDFTYVFDGGEWTAY